MKHSKIKSILNKKAVKKIWNSKCKSFACSHFFSLVKVFSFVNILFKNDSLHIVQFYNGGVLKPIRYVDLADVMFLMKTKGLFNTCFESIH